MRKEEGEHFEHNRSNKYVDIGYVYAAKWTKESRKLSSSQNNGRKPIGQYFRSQ